MAYLFGRKPRSYDPRVPHLSAYLAGKPPATIPTSKDWAVGMSKDFGMMMNDRLGCCAESAVYHGVQTWSFNAHGVEDTESDDRVVQLYETQGYNPADPSTDQGTNLQQLLLEMFNVGVPLGPNGYYKQKILAYLEVDPRNLTDVFRTILECGGSYIGLNVPQPVVNAINSGAPIPNVWTGPPDPTAGHCVWVPSYDQTTSHFEFISWGSRYIMPAATWTACVQESYAILDPKWIELTRSTPFGLTIQQTEQAMSALKLP